MPYVIYSKTLNCIEFTDLLIFLFKLNTLTTFIKRITGLEPVSEELQVVCDAKVVPSLCFAERIKQFGFGTCSALATWDCLILKLTKFTSTNRYLPEIWRQTKLHKSYYQGKFLINPSMYRMQLQGPRNTTFLYNPYFIRLEVSNTLSRQEAAYIQKRTEILFGLSPRLKPQELGFILRSASNSSVTLKNTPIPFKIEQIK